MTFLAGSASRTASRAAHPHPWSEQAVRRHLPRWKGWISNLPPRRHPRPARTERRRQVDADQDPGRRLSRRRRGDCGGRPSAGQPGRPLPRACRSSTRTLASSSGCPSPRTSPWAPAIGGAAASSPGVGCASAVLAALRSPSRSTSTPMKQIAGLTRAERSLVAIARALAAETEVIVLDEPTASLPAPRPRPPVRRAPRATCRGVTGSCT